MQYIHINFWAVLLAAILGMIIQMAWYSPKVFGRFRDETKAKPIEENENTKLIISFVTILIMSYILSYAVFFADGAQFYDGISAAFYLWLGFVATTSLFDVLRKEKTFLLYLIDNSLWLIILMLMGGILSVWR